MEPVPFRHLRQGFEKRMETPVAPDISKNYQPMGRVSGFVSEIDRKRRLNRRKRKRGINQWPLMISQEVVEGLLSVNNNPECILKGRISKRVLFGHVVDIAGISVIGFPGIPASLRAV